MSADDDDVDTSRKTVKTFVPAYQKDAWKRHADDLDMSQSEFVRTMVQAGRRDFELESPSRSESSPEGDASGGVDESGTGGGDGGRSGGGHGGGGGDLDERIVSILSGSEHLSWDELVARLTTDIEDRLEETLQRLQTENRVQYSGRHGGYAVVMEGNDGN
jgi:hypothetical protein